MANEIKAKKALPYYNTSDSFLNVVKSSRGKKQNLGIFILKKAFNYICALLAYTCPINSLRVFFHRLRGVNIGKNVFIGLRCTLDHAYPDYIYIYNNVTLSGDIYIVAHTKPPEYFKKKISSFVAPVIIGENCFIGVCCVILPGVKIGNGSFIAGGSIVTKNIPDNSVARGNPAIVIHNLG